MPCCILLKPFISSFQSEDTGSSYKTAVAYSLALIFPQSEVHLVLHHCGQIMTSFKALVLTAYVLSIACLSFGQTVVVISDNPVTGTAVGYVIETVQALHS